MRLACDPMGDTVCPYCFVSYWSNLGQISLQYGTSYGQKYEICFNQSLLTISSSRKDKVGFLCFFPPFLFLSTAPPFSLLFFLENPLPPIILTEIPSHSSGPESDHLRHPVCRLSKVPLPRLTRGQRPEVAALLQRSCVGGSPSKPAEGPVFRTAALELGQRNRILSLLFLSFFK